MIMMGKSICQIWVKDRTEVWFVSGQIQFVTAGLDINNGSFISSFASDSKIIRYVQKQFVTIFFS